MIAMGTPSDPFSKANEGIGIYLLQTFKKNHE
jgi:hypothetical protein